MGNNCTQHEIQDTQHSGNSVPLSPRFPTPFSSGVATVTMEVLPGWELGDGLFLLLLEPPARFVCSRPAHTHSSSDVVARSLGIWTMAFNKPVLLSLRCLRKVMLFLCCGPSTPDTAPHSQASCLSILSPFHGSHFMLKDSEGPFCVFVAAGLTAMWHLTVWSHSSSCSSANPGLWPLCPSDSSAPSPSVPLLSLRRCPPSSMHGPVISPSFSLSILHAHR